MSGLELLQGVRDGRFPSPPICRMLNGDVVVVEFHHLPDIRGLTADLRSAQSSADGRTGLIVLQVTPCIALGRRSAPTRRLATRACRR